MSHAAEAIASARHAYANLARAIEQLDQAEAAREPDVCLVDAMDVIVAVAELGAERLGCELHMKGLEELWGG
jgi:hypothetical protein